MIDTVIEVAFLFFFGVLIYFGLVVFVVWLLERDK
jgi:hypothetical protein